MPANTKRALADSFRKLLSKRELNKITVKDIVEDCGVNRQTFYYYFHDVYELMEWIFQDTADTLLGECQNYEDWSSGLHIVMDFLRQNRVLVWNAYRSVSHKAVSSYIKRMLGPYALRVVQVQAGNMPTPAAPEDIEFVSELLTLAAVGVITEWIDSGQTQIPEKRMEKFLAAMSGSVPFMLRNLQENSID